MTSYLAGAGGVNTPDGRTANVCPHSLQHGADGDCSEAIASLPTVYKLAPGTRHMFSPSPDTRVMLKPFQWTYQHNATCPSGWEPYPGGRYMSCRPVTLLGNPECSRELPYGNGRLYSYST